MMHPGGIAIDGSQMTDDNRKPIDISYDTIETSQRMIDGTRRKQVRAVKRKVSVNWENLVYASSQTFDKKGALAALDAKWATRSNPVVLRINKVDGNNILGGQYEEFTAYFESYTKELTKRGTSVRMWDVSVEFVEV